METQYINLNMTPTGVNPCFHISQYDDGRMLGFIVHSGGATVDLDTYTCTIEATRSDGTAITSAVATTDNIGTFEVTPTMSNKTDKYRCQLVIVDANSKRIASLPFDMEVTKAAMDENSEAIEEDASLYQQYTEAVQGAIAEANADIQAEASARASADSNLQSQINQIVAPSGEAPSAAEVQNARIGANGVTYDTLGNAIRGQVTDLKSDLGEAYDEIGLPFVKLQQGTLNSDGSDGDSSVNSRVRSNYIPVDDTLTYKITYATGISFTIYFFDATGTQIDRRSWDNTSTYITVQSGAHFVRLLFKNSTNTVIHPNDIGLEFEPIKAANDINDRFFEYQNTTVGIANRTLIPKICAVNNGVEVSNPTRALTDLCALSAGFNYTISATLNGLPIYALAIYYNANLQETSRGSFSNTPFALAPQEGDKYFAVFLKRDNNNTAFEDGDRIEVELVPSCDKITDQIQSIKNLCTLDADRNETIITEQGVFDDNGLNHSGTTRLRSAEFYPVEYLSCVEITLESNADNYMFLPIFYDDAYYGTHQTSRGGWITGNGVFTVTDKSAKFMRLYIRNTAGSTIQPSDVVVKAKCKHASISIKTFAPALSKMPFKACAERIYGQDIAVYDGNIFDFDTGYCSINGGASIAITNGHGNNCCFGDELHGDYPYLYCASWNQNDCKIYVNQYANGAFTLVRTITFDTLTGYLNACVDEANNRAYILLNTSNSTYDGVVDFIIADLSGTIIERKHLDITIPVIEGMTYYDGAVLVSSGHGISYPSYIHVFDTQGNLLSKSVPMSTVWDTDEWIDAIEGIDVDKVTGELYIALVHLIFKA